MTCIVTGGNGYIGSHMCKYLCEKGFDVHVVDNHSTSPQSPVHNFGKFHRLDIRDTAPLTALLQKTKPQYIFHFAAHAFLPLGELDPIGFYQNNVTGTLSLLDACTQTGHHKIVFSSSCTTFGNTSVDKISEQHPQNPINTYGKSKLMCEQMLTDLAQKKLVDVIILRYFNAVGCLPDLGENHSPECHLIPNLCLAYLQKRPFQLYGTDFDTPDGTCIRDFIHVQDLVLAHLQAANFIKKQNGHFAFNLGQGKGHSLKEVISLFEQITNSKLPVEIMPRRTCDPVKLIADSSLAQKTLQFKCKFSLREAIEQTLAYTASKLESKISE